MGRPPLPPEQRLSQRDYTARWREKRRAAGSQAVSVLLTRYAITDLNTIRESQSLKTIEEVIAFALRGAAKRARRASR